jgi:hypothetical protein
MFIVTQTLYPDNYCEVYVISDLQALEMWMDEHEFEGKVKQNMQNLAEEAQETRETLFYGLSSVSYKVVYIEEMSPNEWFSL